MSGWWRFSWCVLCVLCALVACRRQGDELAKLESRSGTVDRDFAKERGKWSDAPLAASFQVGDGIRTAAAASAKLRLSDASAVSLQEKTLLRFLATPPGAKAQGLDVQAGEIELQVGERQLRIETTSGPALLEPGSRVTLRKTERGTRFAVEIGAAHLTELKQDLAAGESIEIGIGRAVIERSAATGPAASTSAAPVPLAAPSAAAVAEKRELPADETRARGPEPLDLLLGAGDSLTIHDPKPPTAIGFAGPKCQDVLVLELGSKKRETVGVGRVSAHFAPGVQRYSLRCEGDEEPFARGAITVLRDSGSRRLASGAPVNRIDTDGRRYTILYQSQLPRLSVRWPNAPAAGPYRLSVRSGRLGTRQFSSASPSQSLPSGALAEGSYELWFDAAGKRSRTTTVVVQFDNAAPTASISSPAEGGFAPGSTVVVSGMALPGWAVTAGGHELAQDAQWRFSGEVQAPAEVRGLLIRFSHPQRGVHYYLRRSSN